MLNLQVPIGFGFMNASWAGSPVLTSADARAAFIEALHFAMDQGVTLFDTADIYAPSWNQMGHNELLLAEAISSWGGTPAQKSALQIATKGGITRAEGEVWGRDASAEYLVSAAHASAKRLGVTQIPVWQHHRLDPNRTIQQAVSGLLAVKNSGVAKNLGVSNYSASQLRMAFDAVGGPADGGLVSVQNQLNAAYHHDLDVLEVCEELGLAFLPWTPMKGARASENGTPSFEALSGVAAVRGVSNFVVAGAWLRGLSANLVLMPGVTRQQSVADSLAGLSFELTEDEHLMLAESLVSGPVDAELISDQPKP